MDFEKLYCVKHCGLSTMYSFSPTVYMKSNHRNWESIEITSGQLERGIAGYRSHKIANEISEG